MDIHIKIDPKEVAALVLALQERQACTHQPLFEKVDKNQRESMIRALEKRIADLKNGVYPFI